MRGKFYVFFFFFVKNHHWNPLKMTLVVIFLTKGKNNQGLEILLHYEFKQLSKARSLGLFYRDAWRLKVYLLRTLKRHNTCMIEPKLMGGDSEYFSIVIGSQYGSTLSSYLFPLVMDELT